jgi:hypothetical protein
MAKKSINSTMVTVALLGVGGYILYKVGPSLLNKLKGSSTSAYTSSPVGAGGGSDGEQDYEAGYMDAMAAAQQNQSSPLGNLINALLGGGKSSSSGGKGSNGSSMDSSNRSNSYGNPSQTGNTTGLTTDEQMANAELINQENGYSSDGLPMMAQQLDFTDPGAPGGDLYANANLSSQLGGDTVSLPTAPSAVVSNPTDGTGYGDNPGGPDFTQYDGGSVSPDTGGGGAMQMISSDEMDDQ